VGPRYSRPGDVVSELALNLMTKAKLPGVVGVPLMSAIKCANGLSGTSYLGVDPPIHMVISRSRGGSCEFPPHSSAVKVPSPRARGDS
jgi:hypothetical protein